MSEPTIPQKPPFEETDMNTAVYTGERVRVLIFLKHFWDEDRQYTGLTTAHGSLEEAEYLCQELTAGQREAADGARPLRFVDTEDGWFALYPNTTHPKTGYYIRSRIVENAEIIRKLDV